MQLFQFSKLKKIILLSVICYLASGIFTTKTSAADFCCLPGYLPQNGECVNTNIGEICQGIASGICDLDIQGYSLCSLIPVSDISSMCISANFSAGGLISPSSICQTISLTLSTAIGKLPLGIVLGPISGPIIYNGCLPVAETIFNGMPNLGGLVKTPNLCITGMGNRFYFCFQNGDPNRPGIPTALGCIPYITTQFVSDLLIWSLGIGSAFTFITIIWGAILIITGSHDPKKIQAGWEMIIAAISGTIMIVICVLLINYLGDQVLNLGPIGFSQ